MKRLITLMLVMIMLLTVTVGCSKNEGAKTDTPAKSDAKATTTDTKEAAPAADNKEAVTITYGIWDSNQEPGLRKIADAFEAANAGIKVEIQVTPWEQYWTMLEAAATGGELPDVFWMHSNEIARYSANGLLMDLTDKIAGSSLVDLSKFPQGLVDIYKWEGKTQYAVPKDFDTIGLWYNKTLFDAAGVAYPDESWTWDTFLSAAKQLTNASTGVYGFAAPLRNQEGYHNFIYQNGGKVISDDKTQSGYHDAATVEAMQWYVDLILKEKVSPDLATTTENAPAALLESGKVAMGVFGSWMLSEFSTNEYTAANCDVAVLPKGKNQASIFNGLGNVAAANSAHPEEAWKFVEYLGSKEAQDMQATLGTAISAYEGSAQLFIASNPKINLKAYVDMLSYAVIRPFSKKTVEWENLEIETLKAAFAGEKTVPEVCDTFAKAMDEILASEK